MNGSEDVSRYSVTEIPQPPQPPSPDITTLPEKALQKLAQLAKTRQIAWSRLIVAEVATVVATAVPLAFKASVVVIIVGVSLTALATTALLVYGIYTLCTKHTLDDPKNALECRQGAILDYLANNKPYLTFRQEAALLFDRNILTEEDSQMLLARDIHLLNYIEYNRKHRSPTQGLPELNPENADLRLKKRLEQKIKVLIEVATYYQKREVQKEATVHQICQTAGLSLSAEELTILGIDSTILAVAIAKAQYRETEEYHFEQECKEYTENKESYSPEMQEEKEKFFHAWDNTIKEYLKVAIQEEKEKEIPLTYLDLKKSIEPNILASLIAFSPKLKEKARAEFLQLPFSEIKQKQYADDFKLLVISDEEIYWHYRSSITEELAKASSLEQVLEENYPVQIFSESEYKKKLQYLVVNFVIENLTAFLEETFSEEEAERIAFINRYDLMRPEVDVLLQEARRDIQKPLQTRRKEEERAASLYMDALRGSDVSANDLSITTYVSPKTIIEKAEEKYQESVAGTLCFLNLHLEGVRARIASKLQ